MFGKLTQKLRYIAAPAVIAIAGLFTTAEQAEAAKIDVDQGKVTVESGDSLSKIARQLAKLGVQTTAQDIQAANPDLIKDVNKIKVGQVFVVPKAIEKAVLVAATTPETSAAEPCEDKSKLEYWTQQVEAEHGALTADAKAIIAQEKLEAFQEGQKCETCATDQDAAAVAPHGMTSSPVPKARPVVEAAVPDATPPATANTYEVKPGDALCAVVRAENKSFDDIVAHNSALKAPYELNVGQTLDLTDVGTLNKKEDKLYKDYCTGSGPVVHKPADNGASTPVFTPKATGATITRQCEMVQSGKRLYALPLAKKFEERCGCANEPFKTTRIVLEDGKIVQKTVWGNPANQCEKGGDHDPKPIDPVEPPPVDPPDGGCKEHCGGEGGGETPNPDVDGDHGGGGGNNPPGPGDNDGENTDGSNTDHGNTEDGTSEPEKPTTEPEAGETGVTPEGENPKEREHDRVTLNTTSNYGVVNVSGSIPRFDIA